MSHARWKTLRERKLAEGYTEPDDVAEVRREIQLSIVLAKAVYDRRSAGCHTQHRTRCRQHQRELRGSPHRRSLKVEMTGTAGCSATADA